MKNIGININELNQVIAAFDDPVNGDIRVDVDESTFDDIFNKLLPHRCEDGALVIDTVKQVYESKEMEILELKQKLEDTDKVMNKITEYQYLELEIPEELDQIIRERQVWRDGINELEEEMNALL